jgi:hypothetical protein
MRSLLSDLIAFVSGSGCDGLVVSSSVYRGANFASQKDGLHVWLPSTRLDVDFGGAFTPYAGFRSARFP